MLRAPDLSGPEQKVVWAIQAAPAGLFNQEGVGEPFVHWDVIKDEATREGSKSRAPMFGASFSLA